VRYKRHQKEGHLTVYATFWARSYCNVEYSASKNGHCSIEVDHTNLQIPSEALSDRPTLSFPHLLQETSKTSVLRTIAHQDALEEIEEEEERI